MVYGLTLSDFIMLQILQGMRQMMRMYNSTLLLLLRISEMILAGQKESMSGHDKTGKMNYTCKYTQIHTKTDIQSERRTGIKLPYTNRAESTSRLLVVMTSSHDRYRYME